ncbi:peptidoglycan DD-metalloendopeptidase family protein [Celeribacter baekdonensis]|uniref:peptidoglycan DD-metalloendopeptidase family protein n=1 Tax=Celeribacter baekdonensis TaxID=875171 RepID=UPI0030D76061|tara:strand:- start:12000 stop:12983 length:984 start_codon:yes stop_codon:yes gene_type:complete
MRQIEMPAKLAHKLAVALRDAPDVHRAIVACLDGVTVSAVSVPEDQADGLYDQVRAALDPVEDAALIQRLEALDPAFLTAVIRYGLGHAPIPHATAIHTDLARVAVAPVMRPDPNGTAFLPLPSDRVGMPAFSDRAFDAWFTGQRAPDLPADQPLYGYGLYGEQRSVYMADQYRDASGPEPRSRHLGIDIFAPAGTMVCAPLPGRVHRAAYNADPLDYGHTVILEHRTAEGLPFWTLYGHLGAPLPALAEGADIAIGQDLAPLGDWHENGGWAPHLHFQIITSLLTQTGGNFFGVGHDSLWPVWSTISPDPNLILRLPNAAFGLKGL